MTCSVCNDDGVVTVEVRRAGAVVQETRPCSVPSCVVGGVTRLYREMEKS